MVIKYRVHEVAKDFDRDTKDIVALLGNYYEEPKKSMTALEEDELNTIFEVITQGNQVENFDAYFAEREAGTEEGGSEEGGPEGGREEAGAEEGCGEIRREACREAREESGETGSEEGRAACKTEGRCRPASVPEAGEEEQGRPAAVPYPRRAPYRRHPYAERRP